MTRIFDRNPIQGHRPAPWKPPLSTDVPAAEKPKCLGDLVREQAEREGRIGSETRGTPGDGDHNLTGSWYEKHPDKLPGNPQTMTKQAMKLKPLDAVKAQGQRRRRERERAGRKVIDGTGGFNRTPTRKRGRLPIFHKPVMLVGGRRDPLRRRAPLKSIKRWTTAEATDNGSRGA
jgi:hypothetical protein